MNILEFYKDLNSRDHSGVTVVIHKDNIDRNRVESILKKRYLGGCSEALNCFVFNLEEEYNGPDIYSAIKSYPFGCDKNLIILYSFHSIDAERRKELISFVDRGNNGNIFIFTREKYKNLSVFNTIEISQIGKRPSAIKSVVKSIAVERGIKLTPDNINTVARLCGNNPEKISSALEQIELMGNELNNKPELFARIIGEESQITFYKMSKSFLDKDKNAVMRNIDNMLNWGVHPIMFLSMFKKMILKIVSVYEGYELKGDYLEDRYIKAAKKLNKKNIEKLFDLFYNMEYKIRVAENDRDVIKFYILEILKAI